MASKNPKDDKEKNTPKNKSSSSSKNSSAAKKTSASKSTSSSKAAKTPFSKDIYETLIQNVSIISLHDKTINLLKKDKTLQETIECYINAIYTYEQAAKPKSPKAADLKAGYDAIVGVELSLKKLTKQQLEDLEDKIHFLPIYISNSLGLDWDELMTSFNKSDKSKNNISNPLLAAAVGANASTNNAKAERVNAEQTEFNASDFMRKNNVTMDQIAEGMIEQQAQAILWKQIGEGKFYRYSSKPSFFIWMKWALFALWILCAIVLLIQQFAPMAIGSSTVYMLLDQLPGTSTTQGPTFTIDNKDSWKTILNNILPIPNNTTGILGAVVSLIVPACIILYAVNQVRNYKNDNAKFTCKTFMTWLIVFSILWLFTPYFNFADKLFDFSRLEHYKNIVYHNVDGSAINSITYKGDTGTINLSINQSKVYDIIMIISICTILYLALSGVAVLVSIAIIVTRPKNDTERIMAKIAEIKEDIKSGRIDLSAENPGGIMGGGWRNPFSPY